MFGEDIFKETAESSTKRIKNAGRKNVTVVLGTPGRSRGFPPASLDHALLVHMYHEVENPYELLWNLRSSLRPGATVGIIDADRPTRNHGTPPWLLDCEVGAIGFARKNFYPARRRQDRHPSTPDAATKPGPRARSTSSPAARHHLRG